MNDIVYLYGFVPRDSAVPPGALSGVHGAAVSLLAIGDVRAVISQLPADEFSAEVIESRIDDLNWVGARGLEHERVVAWFVDNADILPVSLFTLYSSETALAADAQALAGKARAQLARLSGKREWDLKVSYDHTKLAAHAAEVMESIRAVDAEIATAAAGKRFLLEKKRADLLKQELPGAARKKARELLEHLASHASSVVALPAARSEGVPVVLNAALLVARDAERALRDAAAEQEIALGEVGIHMQLTGPWAPYRFMESADDDA